MYNKGAIKIFSFLFVFLFLISFTSSLDWDDKVDFTKSIETSKWGKYEIYDSVLFMPFVKGDKLATYELVENSYSVLNGYAEIEVELFADEQITADLKVYDKNGNEVQLKSLTKTLLVEREIIEDKPIYNLSCEYILSSNGTNYEVCEDIQIGTEKVSKIITEEIEYNGEIKSIGKYKLILRGQRSSVNDGLRDWVITTGAGNKELKEWAVWWDTNWNRKKVINVSLEAGESISDYQILLTVNYESEMKADFSDLRFINSSQDGELDYWVQEKTDSTSAKIWVKVTNLTASGVTEIYMYYGNSIATSNSDGKSTFIMFDDFPGSAVNTTIWEEAIGSASVSGGILNVATTTYLKLQNQLLPTGLRLIRERDWVSGGTHNTWGFWASGGVTTPATDCERSVFNYNTGGNFDFTSNNPNGCGYDQANSLTIAQFTGWHNETITMFRNATANRQEVILDGVSKAINTEDMGTDSMNVILGGTGLSGTPTKIQRVMISKYTFPEPTYVFGAEEVLPSVIVILISPIDNFNSTITSLDLSCNSTSGNGVLNLSLIIDDIFNETISNTTSNQNITLTKNVTDISEGIHNWTCQGCDETECKTELSRQFTIHLTAPTINITEPTGQINSFILGNNQTLSWQVTEPGQNLTEHITNCSYNYNGVEIQVNLSDCLISNTTSFLYIQGVNNLTFTATDNFGIVASNITFWEYTILELNQTFNTPVIELSDESFELFVESLETITQALLNYNGTNYISTLLSLGAGLYQITTTIQIPSFDANSNVTFFYNISTSSVSGIITQNQTQEVRILNVGNCTAFSNLLMNLSLFDEKSLERINGTIEFDLEILNPSDDSVLNKLSTIFEDISTTSVCADLNISAGDYIYSLELRYFSQATNSSNFNHVPEFYHIQKADVSGLPQIINLYDLARNESTEFTIFYRDNDYIARENVLLQIQRKYVDEGIFRVIEIPITSSEGTAVGHFDLNNYKYKITVTEDGVVLNTFDNPSIRCESELSGICEINLKGLASTPSADFTSNLEDFFYTVDQTNSSVIVDFSIPTGESKLVNIEMVQTSAFADPITICNQSILSSAGQIECDITPSIGDSSVQINIVSDSKPKGNLRATFQEDLNTSFLLNNYFIGAIMLITLILMFVSSPQLMIGASVFGLVFLGLIFILKSSTVGLALGAVAWLIVAGFIILTKLNKKAEQ